MSDSYDNLKIENQICFPLYACAKEVTRRYKPLLDKLDLTYTQYIVMMVMWEYKKMNVKELGEKVYLDSGTLTPLLLKLEAKGFVAFKTDAKDKRKQRIVLTKKCMNFCAKNDDVGKDVMEKMFAGIPEKDINKTIQTIMKIESNMKEE